MVNTIIPVQTICQPCGGVGQVEYEPNRYYKCSYCDGSGEVEGCKFVGEKEPKNER